MRKTSGDREDVERQQSTQKRWKSFEDLVAEIQRELAPNADVCTNQRILGRKSRVLRQIDVLVRHNEHLTIFDCKDYNRRVDVKTVEEFIGLADDVGASAAILVAGKGFTQAAKNRAAASGVQLFTVADTRDHPWTACVTMPFLWEHENVTVQGLSLVVNAPINTTLPDATTLLLYDKDRRPLDTVLEVADKYLKCLGQLIKPGVPYEKVNLTTSDTYIRTHDAIYVPVVAQADFILEKGLYFRQMPLTKVKGFHNELTNLTRTNGFGFDWQSTAEVGSEWRQIESKEQLGIHVPITIVDRTVLYKSP